MDTDNVNVSYSVKELLDRMDRKLDGISDKLDLKATIAEVQDIALKQSQIVSRVSALEQARKHDEATTDDFRATKERVWNVALGIALVVVTLVGVLGIHL